MRSPRPSSPVSTCPTVRRLSVDVHATAPKYWFRGSPILTSMAYAMSAIFPVGEPFFVKAVKAAVPHIRSPETQAAARAFMAQEAQHAHLHTQYNDRATADGFRVGPLTERLAPAAERVQRTFSLRSQLAITAAFEHFTAILSTQILGEPGFMGDAPTPHGELWRWHAAEEAEHKAVAFDVLADVGPSYARRIAWYLLVSASFTCMTGLRMLYLMWHDGTVFRLGHYASALRWLVCSSGIVSTVLPRWLAYLKPSFHPDDHDDSALIEAWELEWAGPADALGQAS